MEKVDLLIKAGVSQHFINGKLVNEASNPSLDEAGKILLQSEGVEIYYKNISIKALWDTGVTIKRGLNYSWVKQKERILAPI